MKYSYRLVNPETHRAPQNELSLEGLLGYEFLNFIKLGPSITWVKGDKRKYLGEKADKLSEKESLSAGGEVYLRLEPVKLSFSYLYDLYVENTARGHFLQVKMVFKL